MEFYERSKPHLQKVEEQMNAVLGGERKDVYGMLYPFIKRGGKRIRPLLAILACEAVGGDVQKVIRPAAAIELFHNFTLIHDDIADDSQFRRGEPTLHATYGIPIALNFGDALYTIVWRDIVGLDIEPARLVRLQSLYADTFKLVVEGQGMELDWYHNKRFDITEKNYFEMINRKTAALIGLSCKLGGFIGNADEKTMEALWSFGEKIGTAFQIHDDVLNIVGDFEKYQKEIGGDISEGKRSLIIVHFLSAAGDEDKKKVVEVLSTHSKKKEDIEQVIALLKKHGSTDYASGVAKKLVDDAKKELDVLPDSEAKEALIAVADFVVSREL
ncbi:TPA: polyprenyl synthetase family protein [Candidatus Micrarchaeota archaeon]|nr:polyprenyl synthetase family protein [Candidatus Micrarchaeota archaeon]